MSITSIIAVMVGAIGAVIGFVFGMRQNDKRKAAEEAMEKQDDIIKAQATATKNAVQESASRRKENARKTREKKQEVVEAATPPTGVGDRLDRLRK